jgi:dethiobiotin synthetase
LLPNSFHVDLGLDIMQWRESTENLLDLKADILCEGHFGIYSPIERVEHYNHF